MKYFLMIITFLYSQLLLANIYTYTDAHGNIIYTDEPMKDAKEIQMIVMPETAAPTVTSKKNVATRAASVIETRKPYTTFLIASPKDQETIHNQPNILLNLTIIPSLQMGDQIQVFVDEVSVGNVTKSADINLGRLERGIHTIRATLLDQDQKILKLTQTITIFVHQAHLGTGTPFS